MPSPKKQIQEEWLTARLDQGEQCSLTGEFQRQSSPGSCTQINWRIWKHGLLLNKQSSPSSCNGRSSQLKRVFRMTDLRTKNKSVYRPVLKETHRSTDSQQPQITAAMAVEEGESGARRAKRPAQAGQRDGRFRRRRLCGRGDGQYLPNRGQYRSKVACRNRFPARLRLVRKV